MHSPRRRYGDEVRRVLRDTYGMHPSAVRASTTGYLRDVVDAGYRMGDTPEHTAMRVYEDCYDTRFVDADGRPLRYQQASQ